jgi:CDP-diacylglycerol--serine O-phosphatidyltransferase
MKMPNIAVLPSLVTLGNAVCGFVAVGIMLKAPHLDLTPGADNTRALTAITMAGFLILLAMVFDALDGRIARFTRSTSDFGGQLDSLCDAVSFGAAPALLAYRLFVDTVGKDNLVFDRLAIIMAAVYACCAILRLARFNVENVHDEESHLWFRGLPSPAAAGAVAGLVILVPELWTLDVYPELSMAVIWSLPVVMLVTGILMVSNVRYSHVVNQMIRGRRPLSYILQILICVALIFFLQEKVLALLFIGYVFTGPLSLVYRRVMGVHRPAASPSADGKNDLPKV